MVKIIKRTTDNKFLHSMESDVWVDGINDALTMTYKECEDIKEILSNTYSKEEITEIADFYRTKSTTKEEKKELLSLLKNK